MNRLVVDSYAWIEYLDGTEIGQRVGELIGEENDEIFTCALTVAEVVSKAARKGKNVKIAYEVLTNDSKIIHIDEQLSFEAGFIHFEMRKTIKDFGLADAFVIASARKTQSKILTGDAHFKNVKEAILLK